MNNKSKSNKTVMIILLLLAAVIVGGIGGLAVYFMTNPEPEQKQETKGVVGVVTDGWDTDVSKDPNSQESKQGTIIPGYSIAEMNEGDTALHLRVGNPSDNKVGMFATVKLEDGTVLYSSPLLKPGQGLEEIPLETTLVKGEYKASVYYKCVLLDEDNTPLNAAESAFTLIVN